MKFTDFKFSLEKSWGFTYQVLVLIVLGFVAILLMLVLIWKLTENLSAPFPGVSTLTEETKPSTAVSEKKPPKENWFSINAVVTGIDKETNKISIRHYSFSDLEWDISVNNNTELATYESWQEATNAMFEARKQMLNSEKQEQIFNKTVKNLSLKDFNTEDIIYVIAKDDFAKNNVIKEVSTILKYINKY